MDIDIQTILTILVIFGFGVGAHWLYAKRKIREIRELIDAVDDAIYDDKVTENEFRNIWMKGKNVLRR